MSLIHTIKNNDWATLRRVLQKLDNKLGPNAHPTHAGLTLTDLTASRLIWGDADKILTSKDLIDLVAGINNEIDIADDTNGGIVIGIVNPLIVAKGGTGVATLTDHGILLGSGTGAVTSLAEATDGQLPIGDTDGDPILATITGTANQVNVANAAGSITLSTPQDIDIAATPTFAGLTLTNAAVIGSNSVVFQPGTDSTTFLQVLDADGGTPIFNVDTIKEFVGFGTAAPNAPVEVKGVKPGVVGGFQSGQLQVTGSGTEFYCAVITGHNAFNGNTQLWYLGNTSSSSHNDVAFINRQNAPMHFYTNNTSRMTIDAAGNVGIITGNLDVAGGITSGGIIQATDFAKTGWPVTPGVILSFVGGTTRTFTVTDGGSAYYYIDGVKYTLGENKTVVIDDLEGLWFIYFDGATLTASQTIWSFLDENKVLVGYLYWARDVGTPANGKAIFIGQELHSFHMSGATHARLHYAGGARWETGLLVADAGGGNVNVSAGDIWDEDLNIPITDDDTPTALFEQILSPAQLPIYYRDGASAWRIYETNEKAIATDAGYVDISDDLKYNKLNGTWANATVGLNNYVAYWVVATNEQTEPVVLIMGQRFDNKLSEAKENNIFGGLNLTGLPFEEMVVLARLILKDTGSGVFYTLEEVLDLRALSIGGNITSPLITQHAGLGGLNWANAGHTFDAAVDLNGQDLANGGVIFLTEQAAAEADVGDKGQLWVKSGAPNQLWFTDDVGTDVQLGVGDAADGAYVERPSEPTTWDFSVGNLTTDDTWRDLDLSGIVPAGARAVLLRVVIEDDTTSTRVAFRKNGYSDFYNVGVCKVYVVNITHELPIIITCDTNRVIEYRASNVTWTSINIVVCGWWT